MVLPTKTEVCGCNVVDESGIGVFHGSATRWSSWASQMNLNPLTRFFVFALFGWEKQQAAFTEKTASDKSFSGKFVCCCCGCRWSRTYKEGGHYSVWMQTPAASADPICSVSVDKSPNNAYVRKYNTLNEDAVTEPTFGPHRAQRLLTWVRTEQYRRTLGPLEINTFLLKFFICTIKKI